MVWSDPDPGVGSDQIRSFLLIQPPGSIILKNEDHWQHWSRQEESFNTKIKPVGPRRAELYPNIIGHPPMWTRNFDKKKPYYSLNYWEDPQMGPVVLWLIIPYMWIRGGFLAKLTHEPGLSEKTTGEGCANFLLLSAKKDQMRSKFFLGLIVLSRLSVFRLSGLGKIWVSNTIKNRIKCEWCFCFQSSIQDF